MLLVNEIDTACLPFLFPSVHAAAITIIARVAMIAGQLVARSLLQDWSNCSGDHGAYRFAAEVAAKVTLAEVAKVSYYLGEILACKGPRP
jgi:hypothetical protein